MVKFAGKERKSLRAVIILSLLVLSSCNLQVKLPGKRTYDLNDTITFSIKDKKSKIVSSSILFHGEQLNCDYDGGQARIYAGDLYTGTDQLSLILKLKNGKERKHHFNVFIVSDIIPEKYTLEVTGELPHDTSAFTEGLLFHKGLIYESTGLKGRSSLRIIDPSSGECIKDKFTDPLLFNEGISFINDTLYCLTWKDSTVVIYDEELNELGRHALPVEGWGLIPKNNELWLSNGTNKIIKFDPVTFDLTDTLKVANNKGPVHYINEMEWVEGNIWANIYGEDEIIVIDGKSGKILCVLSGEKLIDRKRFRKAGVMNGIAYDQHSGRVFITGKNWPEIKICKAFFVK